VAGGAKALASAAARRGIDVPIIPVDDMSRVGEAFGRGLPVLPGPDCEYRPAEPDTQGAEAAFASLQFATQLALDGEASGLVTGPVSKALLAEVGFNHPGQTEFVASRCGVSAQNAVMMLAGPSVRTIPLTVHVALARVPSLISVDLIRRRATIAEAALRRDFGIASPRIAVTGLNPHAGEDGKFGDEEELTIAPAIAALREAGIDATGPHPADALFGPHSRGNFDVAICMYHDQALIPIKALDFDEGVNVTLGLPIIRTSPDHGTAFGIAGTGKADAGATIAAIRMAGECARRRMAQRDDG
jgi:4-hydroxythreonine-4-phosphate dehydrogenase